MQPSITKMAPLSGENCLAIEKSQLKKFFWYFNLLPFCAYLLLLASLAGIIKYPSQIQIIPSLLAQLQTESVRGSYEILSFS